MRVAKVGDQVVAKTRSHIGVTEMVLARNNDEFLETTDPFFVSPFFSSSYFFFF